MPSLQIRDLPEHLYQEIVRLAEADWVIAPSLFIYEASNTMWKYHEFKNYSKEDIMEKINKSSKKY